MRSTFTPLIALLLSDAILVVGHGLLLTLLPIAASKQGFSAFEVALTGSAYFLGFVSGCMAAPFILRRVGHIRSFAVLAAIYGCSVLVLALNESVFAWMLLRFVMGAGISGLYTTIESWLNDRCDASNRGTVLSVYAVLNMLMIALGQQLLGLELESSWVLFSLAAICICLAIVPVSLTLALAPAPVKNVRISLKKLWRHSHTGFMGALVAGLVTGAFWSLAPIYAARTGFSGVQIAAFMSATIIGGALFQLPLGKLSDHVERRLVLIGISLFGAMVSVLFYVYGSPGWLAIALALAWGGCHTTIYAIALAHANDAATPDDFVEISSSMLLVLGASSALGAPIASLVMERLGPEGLYLYMAVCSAIFSATVLMRRRQHVITDVEHAEGYQVVPNLTTPAAFELDPRNEEVQKAGDADRG